MATIVDVARAAGVSRGTASNVFAHPEKVRQALRDRVLAAAEALGYGGPNPKGRLLRSGKVHAIGVTPPGAYGIAAAFDSPYLRAFLGGIGEICDQNGSSVTIVNGLGQDTTFGIKNAVVDGFILHRFEEAAVAEALRRNLPCVLVDMDSGEGTSSARIDDRAGARAAAEHLVALGHRDFAIFSVLRDLAPGAGPVFHDQGGSGGLTSAFAIERDRLAGYRDAFVAAGIDPAAVPIVETRADYVAAAAEGARRLLDRHPAVTAVLAMTDIQAIAVIGEARHRGLRVPEDLSVVGFDDIPEAARCIPPLTTVVHPMREKGRTAARLLFDGKSGEHVVLPVHLVVRGSTAPPPGPDRRDAITRRA